MSNHTLLEEVKRRRTWQLKHLKTIRLYHG